MKSKVEIIEETANYYTSENRGIVQNQSETEVNLSNLGTPEFCQYYTPDGKMCGVGRCMINPQRVEERFHDAMVCAMGDTLDDHLKPEYRGHFIEFWEAIQNFHDTAKFWNENGLTEEGLTRKNYLIKNYK